MNRPANRALRSAGFGLLAAWLVVSCSRSSTAGPGSTSLAKAADDAWVGETLPQVAFTDTQGRALTSTDLLGRPFVMDFIFTSCAGPCPTLSDNMRVLQGEVRDLEVRLVSVSVDPELDSPDALSEYARRFSADPKRWWFLSASEVSLQALMGGLHLALERAQEGAASPGFDISHSTRLVVFDSKGRVRGYYDGESKEGRRQVKSRLEFLAKLDP